jgi:hypothetical protein
VTVASTLLDDRYSLEEEIGAGGYCEVWRATDTVLKRPIAVKLLQAGYAHQPQARTRFKAEARHAASLCHDNIARVYDYGEPADGQAYLVMELIGGPSLATVLTGGPLDARRTMDIVAQVAAGLQAAHSAGLVHRDIKPTNIMFTGDGAARITDFGIAHAVGSAPLTSTGMVMGTPGYIAPERVGGAQAGPPSDLYALGIVAYECLAGAPPFAGSPLEVAIAHRDHPLPPLPASLPTDVVGFVMTLTAKDPVWRPASAGEVACQARRLRDRLGPGATGPAPVTAGAPVITGVPASHARGAVLGQPRDGGSRRPRTLSVAAAAGLAALACLMLVFGNAFAPASHQAGKQSSGPPRAAPSAREPSSKTPSKTGAAATPAGRHPAATPDGGIGAVAAVRHTGPAHRARGPGDRGNPAGRANGHGPGHHGPPAGKAPRPGHAQPPGTVLAGPG